MRTWAPATETAAFPVTRHAVATQDPSGRHAALLHLQRIGGNRAVRTLIPQHRAPIQRCGPIPANECGCHDDAPAVSRQEDEPPTTGEGHDLTSSLLHGDPVLEEVKEGRRVLRSRANGPEVERIQQALEAAGHSPGDIDGDYGPATTAAVRRFQAAVGMGLQDQDGRVGKRTITALDTAVRHGGTEPDPDAESDDAAIREKYTRSADEPDRIFFTLGSADLDDQELGKIAAFAGEHTTDEMWLTGLASEEGPESVNAALAQQRIDAVSAELANAGHDATRNPDPSPAQARGSSRYRFMRAVQLSTRRPVSPESCEGQEIFGTCETDAATKVASANARAEVILGEALTAFTLTDRSGELAQRADGLLRELYNTTDADHAETRRAVAMQVLDVLDVIRNPATFVCGNDCHPTCLGGASAVEQNGVIVVCAQGLADGDEAVRPALMIHEAHHAGVEDSTDLTYNFARLLRHLTPEQALRNASSFHGLVINTVQPAGMPLTARLTRITPAQNDTCNVPDPDTNCSRLQRALGWMEEWLGTTDFTTAGIYKRASEARRTGRYPTAESAFAMSFLAPRFGFERQPTEACLDRLETCPTPTENDLRLLAAINDRISLMGAALNEDLTITHRSGQPTRWERRQGQPGTHVEVSDHFMQADDNVRTSILMDELVAATPGISARFAVEYTAWIQFVRQDRERLGPESPQP